MLTTVIVWSIALMPVPALLAVVFLWWFHLTKDKSWVSRWWAVTKTVTLLCSLPLAEASARFVLGLPRADDRAYLVAAGVLGLMALPIVIACVVAFHYFIEAPRRHRRYMDSKKDDERREHRRDVADAAREVRRDAADAKRERRDDKADEVREDTRDTSDEVREEQHADRLKEEGDHAAK